MPRFFPKVFGRKKDGTLDSPGSGELLDGKFEDVSPSVSPSAAEFPELKSNGSPRGRGSERTTPESKLRNFFRSRSRAASPIRQQRKVEELPPLPLSLFSTTSDDGDVLLSDKVIGERKLTPVEAVGLVRACSQAINNQGVDALGIMNPHWYSGSPEVQRRLISLFIHSLTTQSPLYPSFDSEINATKSPYDVSAVLRWALRHLQLEGDAADWYQTFFDEERKAEFPPKAFSDILSPLLPAEHLELLKAVIDIFSSLAAHAETNSTSASKLSKIYGLWVLNSHRVETKDDWRSFYDRWEVAGRQLEHILFARIRNEAIDNRLPIRLVELVRKYPYGASPTTDLRLLPRPKFTTRLKQALLVRVETELTSEKLLPKQKRHPLHLISDALSLTSDSALWTKVVDTSKQEGTGTPLSRIFADDTIRLLSLLPEEDDPKSPTVSLLPLSPASPRAKRLSFSLSEFTGEMKRTTSTQSQATTVASPLSPISADWSLFSASGFGASPTLTPLSSTLFNSDIERTSPPSRKPSTRKSSSIPRKSVEFVAPHPVEETPIAEEEPQSKIALVQVVELDEAFIDFWSDALLDPVASDWPSFVVCKLKSALVPEMKYDEEKTLEWIVMERQYTIKPPPPPPAPSAEATSPDALPERPVSPQSIGKKRFAFWTASRSPSTTSVGSTKSKAKSKDARSMRVSEMGEVLEEGGGETPRPEHERRGSGTSTLGGRSRRRAAAAMESVVRVRIPSPKPRKSGDVRSRKSLDVSVAEAKKADVGKEGEVKKGEQVKGEGEGEKVKDAEGTSAAVPIAIAAGATAAAAATAIAVVGATSEDKEQAIEETNAGTAVEEKAAEPVVVVDEKTTEQVSEQVKSIPEEEVVIIPITQVAPPTTTEEPRVEEDAPVAHSPAEDQVARDVAEAVSEETYAPAPKAAQEEEPKDGDFVVVEKDVEETAKGAVDDEVPVPVASEEVTEALEAEDIAVRAVVEPSAQDQGADEVTPTQEDVKLEAPAELEKDEPVEVETSPAVEETVVTPEGVPAVAEEVAAVLESEDVPVRAAVPAEELRQEEPALAAEQATPIAETDEPTPTTIAEVPVESPSPPSVAVASVVEDSPLPEEDDVEAVEETDVLKEEEAQAVPAVLEEVAPSVVEVVKEDEVVEEAPVVSEEVAAVVESEDLPVHATVESDAAIAKEEEEVEDIAAPAPIVEDVPAPTEQEPEIPAVEDATTAEPVAPEQPQQDAASALADDVEVRTEGEIETAAPAPAVEEVDVAPVPEAVPEEDVPPATEEVQEVAERAAPAAQFEESAPVEVVPAEEAPESVVQEDKVIAPEPAVQESVVEAAPIVEAEHVVHMEVPPGAEDAAVLEEEVPVSAEVVVDALEEEGSDEAVPAPAELEVVEEFAVTERTPEPVEDEVVEPAPETPVPEGDVAVPEIAPEAVIEIAVPAVEDTEEPVVDDVVATKEPEAVPEPKTAPAEAIAEEIVVPAAAEEDSPEVDQELEVEPTVVETVKEVEAPAAPVEDAVTEAAPEAPQAELKEEESIPEAVAEATPAEEVAVEGAVAAEPTEAVEKVAVEEELVAAEVKEEEPEALVLVEDTQDVSAMQTEEQPETAAPPVIEEAKVVEGEVVPSEEIVAEAPIEESAPAAKETPEVKPEATAVEGSIDNVESAGSVVEEPVETVEEVKVEAPEAVEEAKVEAPVEEAPIEADASAIAETEPAEESQPVEEEKVVEVESVPEVKVEEGPVTEEVVEEASAVVEPEPVDEAQHEDGDVKADAAEPAEDVIAEEPVIEEKEAEEPVAEDPKEDSAAPVETAEAITEDPQGEVAPETKEEEEEPEHIVQAEVSEPAAEETKVDVAPEDAPAVVEELKTAEFVAVHEPEASATVEEVANEVTEAIEEPKVDEAEIQSTVEAEKVEETEAVRDEETMATTESVVEVEAGEPVVGAPLVEEKGAEAVAVEAQETEVSEPTEAVVADNEAPKEEAPEPKADEALVEDPAPASEGANDVVEEDEESAKVEDADGAAEETVGETQASVDEINGDKVSENGEVAVAIQEDPAKEHTDEVKEEAPESQPTPVMDEVVEAAPEEDVEIATPAVEDSIAEPAPEPIQAEAVVEDAPPSVPAAAPTDEPATIEEQPDATNIEVVEDELKVEPVARAVEEESVEHSNGNALASSEVDEPVVPSIDEAAEDKGAPVVEESESVEPEQLPPVDQSTEASAEATVAAEVASELVDEDKRVDVEVAVEEPSAEATPSNTIDSEGVTTKEPANEGLPSTEDTSDASPAPVLSTIPHVEQLKTGDDDESNAAVDLPPVPLVDTEVIPSAEQPEELSDPIAEEAAQEVAVEEHSHVPEALEAQHLPEGIEHTIESGSTPSADALLSAVQDPVVEDQEEETKKAVPPPVDTELAKSLAEADDLPTAIENAFELAPSAEALVEAVQATLIATYFQNEQEGATKADGQKSGDVEEAPVVLNGNGTHDEKPAELVAETGAGVPVIADVDPEEKDDKPMENAAPTAAEPEATSNEGTTTASLPQPPVAPLPDVVEQADLKDQPSTITSADGVVEPGVAALVPNDLVDDEPKIDVTPAEEKVGAPPAAASTEVEGDAKPENA